MDTRRTQSISGGELDRDAQSQERSRESLSHHTNESSGTMASAAASHKRTISGSILSRLPFLRPSSEAKSVSSGNMTHSTDGTAATKSAEGSSATVAGTTGTTRPNAQMHLSVKSRSRKGSLRKTALLGGGKLRSNEKRMQVDSDGPKPEDAFSKASSEADSSPIPASPSDSDDHTPRPSYEQGEIPHPESGSENVTWVSQHAIEKSERSNTSDESLPLPGAFGMKSMVGDMSTTDEDEASRFPSRLSTTPSSTTGLSSILKKHIAGESYFPLDTSTLQRRRSSHRPRAKSPLAALPIEPVPALQEEWDYAETEWWGWVILVLTWVVFVMGMGSCFEVWSWAWDVGETPYAPPELEDDPTLPIVGYYPALIILTGVMAWVWVVVAWVGMKYFRHAKMAGDV